jgi:hypothetical protein
MANNTLTSSKFLNSLYNPDSLGSKDSLTVHNILANKPHLISNIVQENNINKNLDEM